MCVKEGCGLIEYMRNALFINVGVFGTTCIYKEMPVM